MAQRCADNRYADEQMQLPNALMPHVCSLMGALYSMLGKCDVQALPRLQ